MPEGSQGRAIPARFKVAIVVLVLAWVVALVVLSRTHTKHQQRRPGPVLPIYPDAYETGVASLPDRGWKTATYSAPLDYPSLEVFEYYDRRMGEQGWSRQGAPELPRWQLSRKDGRRRATLAATWFGPEELHRLDLQLIWEEPGGRGAEDAPPRMSVAATMSRSIIPFSHDAREKEESPFAE